jgi:hypothetical protein
MLLSLALLLSSATALHKKYSKHPPPRFSDPCDGGIPGSWTGFEGPDNHPLGDLYSLAWSVPASPGAWTATMVSGGGWGVGHGQFSPDNLTTTIQFDSGVNLVGNVSQKCGQIDWDNDSRWAIAPPPPAPITDVHLIAMNHLDVGYNGIPGLGLINNIVQRYFDVYFPRAVAVAQDLTAHGGPERLIYTTHGWLAHMYLHCPANFTLSDITLVCPQPAAVQAFRDAVQRGDITWHAAAFNTEYENAYNAAMIAVQFQLSFDLADELGVPRPTTVSLRDVPGTTRALVPLLVANNITAISIGVNGGSPAPDMPNPGVWLDPASGARVLYMQTGQGVGYPNNPGPDPANCGGMCRSTCVTHPATSHALCWAFRTDNSGPPMDADEVFRQFDIARWQFPGAQVYASTYSNFTAVLAGIEAALPVTTAEAGDTWMTSVSVLAVLRHSCGAPTHPPCAAVGVRLQWQQQQQQRPATLGLSLQRPHFKDSPLTPQKPLPPPSHTSPPADHSRPLEDGLLQGVSASLCRVPGGWAVRPPRPPRAGLYAHAHQAARAHLGAAWHGRPQRLHQPGLPCSHCCWGAGLPGCPAQLH